MKKDYPKELTDKYPVEFLDFVESVEAKRPKTVIRHILEHGMITTEELRDTYGYNHPPRAARDVRELGIPLETFNVQGTDGRIIGAYQFGDLSRVRNNVLQGRTVISKQFKQQLIDISGSRCSICLVAFEDRYLQVDHRVPYEIAGDIPAERDPADYMLLCGSHNRAKSWSCEHCPNWEPKNASVCTTCYWAKPDDYQHVAMIPVRRLDITWAEDEVKVFDELRKRSKACNEEMPDYVKRVLEKALKGK